MENKIVKNAWRYWRPIYRYTWALIQKSSYEHFCEYLSCGDRQILDIGTGTGVYIPGLPDSNFYTFSDIDIKSLNKAKIQAEKKFSNPRCEFIHGDAMAAIERSGSVDLISLIHVISVVPHPEQVIAKAIEKLNPGGELLIYISSISKKVPESWQHKFHQFGFRTLRLEDMGLDWKVVRVSPLNECYVLKKSDLKMVGVTGIEPATSCTPSKHATTALYPDM